MAKGIVKKHLRVTTTLDLDTLGGLGRLSLTSKCFEDGKETVLLHDEKVFSRYDAEKLFGNLSKKLKVVDILK